MLPVYEVTIVFIGITNCTHIHTHLTLHMHTYNHVRKQHAHIHRFVSKMPTPTLFITFSLLLKVVEGIGLAMFATASLTLLTQLFLHRKSTLSVSDLAIALLLL